MAPASTLPRASFAAVAGYQHRYWGRSWCVWNNDGDTAYLRNPAGTLIDWCTWGSRGSYTYC